MDTHTSNEAISVYFPCFVPFLLVLEKCITYKAPLYIRLPYILLHDYDYSEYYPNSPQVPPMPLPAISIQSLSMNHIFLKSNCAIFEEDLTQRNIIIDTNI